MEPQTSNSTMLKPKNRLILRCRKRQPLKKSACLFLYRTMNFKSSFESRINHDENHDDAVWTSYCIPIFVMYVCFRLYIEISCDYTEDEHIKEIMEVHHGNDEITTFYLLLALPTLQGRAMREGVCFVSCQSSISCPCLIVFPGRLQADCGHTVLAD